MKKSIANITSLMMIVLLFTAAGYSQVMQQQVLKADVPFEFSVGKHTLPAGEYWVVRVAPHTLGLRDSNNRLLTYFVTSPVLTQTARSTPALKFDLIQGQHVLSQVWPSGATTGYELAVSKRVTMLAQQRSAGADVAASSLSGK